MDGLSPGVVLAHGVGGRQDLPIPFSYAVTGAAVALVVSFLALGLLWRQPRLRGDLAGRPVPAGVQAVVDAPATRLALRLFGLLIAAYVGLAAVFGPDRATNPTAGAVYVLLWVGLIPASVLFGPVWRLVNPLRTLHLGLAGLLRLRPEEGLLPMPRGLGYWPAAVGLLAFVWLELVAPDRTTLPVLRIWFAAYVSVQLLGAAVYGSRWFDRGDAFEVYSSLLGRFSVLGRRADGRLVLRSPLDGVAGIEPAPGLVAVVCVLLGSTAYDGMSNAPFWFNLQQSGALPAEVVGTLGLLGAIGVVAVTYLAATRAAASFGASRAQLAARVGAARAGGVPGRDAPAAAVSAARGPSGGGSARGSGRGGGSAASAGGATAVQVPALVNGSAAPVTRRLPGEFAHSVVPIALGYLVAHYYSLLVLEGQRTLIQLSDPLGTGANWLGTADRGVSAALVTPTGVSTLQVLAVVAGHVLGVVLAHDRAVRLFPRRAALAGQVPLLIVMVGYTIAGLLLLFAG